jgi:hypothetical protein
MALQLEERHHITTSAIACLQRTMFHQSVDTCAVAVRALPDAHLGWSGPSRMNNKQASYQYTQLATMDITADYMEHVKFRVTRARDSP